MVSRINKGQRKFADDLEQFRVSLKASQLLTSKEVPTTSLAAWFLGPKAENEDLLGGLISMALASHSDDRRKYYPADPVFVTDETKQSPEYKAGVKALTDRFAQLLDRLKGSTPFWSYRWQSHMNWDTTLPSMAAYFAAMLYNPNNVAAEASPVTTLLEMQVGDDLCEMLGYPVASHEGMPLDSVRPWGHITCDGSVANLEAMWASRNLKYYPVSLAAALKAESSLSKARPLKISLPDGRREVLASLDTWTLLNLQGDEILAVSTRINQEFGISSAELSAAMDRYSIQSLGFEQFRHRFLQDVPQQPCILAPATMHYSWPKNAAILGIGKDNIEAIRVDEDARMDVNHLRDVLDACLVSRRPVIMNVVVLGSTEESAVDPLVRVLLAREEYRRRGLEFPIHVDAAWGGYFAAVLRDNPNTGPDEAELSQEGSPALSMSTYVTQQYGVLHRSDSITVDPHKAGYVPYPAGGLCYRNSAMRSLVTFTAPVVYHGSVDPTVGVYGVEGSKAGAAAAAVYFSHRVIPTNRTGYGTILGKSLFNSKRLYAALVSMAEQEDPFIIVPLQRLPAERNGLDPKAVAAELEYIRQNIVPKTNKELIDDKQAMSLLRELGSDQVILTYAFNFKRGGRLNQNIDLANALNTAIFQKLSLSPDRDLVYRTPLIITSSSFDPATYGCEFVDLFKQRLGLKGPPGDAIDLLISTTMDPWMTDTAEGTFIPTLVGILRSTVIEAVRQIHSSIQVVQNTPQSDG